MDHTTDLATWKKLIVSLETAEGQIGVDTIKSLKNLFDHLSPQTAPRLQREYESLSVKSIDLIGELFDNIDLSDKPLLCKFLGMLLSFGYFRLAQITYHVEISAPSDQEPDPIYCPNIEKAKWYDLCPLLPTAGTIGWKSILNHGLVREERKLQQVCLKLLSQKLHFYSIISMIDGYQSQSAVINRNGQKVTAKLFEVIRDIACDDDLVVGLDISLFNLLLPFADDEQHSIIIEATVQDLFKPFTSQKPMKSEGQEKIFELIHSGVMNKTNLQDILVTKLIEQLKINVIRRKRRHSVEASSDNGNLTLEGLLGEINDGSKLLDTLAKTDMIELSTKSIQSGYISHWVEIVNRILTQRTLKHGNSIKILGVCSVILVAASNYISDDLSRNLSFLMAKTIADTAQNRLDRLFSSCCPQFLIEFTRTLAQKTQLLDTFESPMNKFYKSYMNRYTRCCMMKMGAKSEAGKLIDFVTFICDKSLSKTTSHLLQYLCVHELASCLDDFKGKSGNKVLDIYQECARTCGKRLYKFIKRNSHLKPTSEEVRDEEMETSELDGSSENLVIGMKNSVVIDALISILRIAIDRQDQEMLDCYSDLLLKIFSVMTSRVQILMDSTQAGQPGASSHLDPHLSKLLILYIEHKDMIKGYLNYDLIETISSLLIIDNPSQSDEPSQEKNVKKIVYNRIKTKLDELEDRAKHSMDVFPTIINKQYSSVVDQSITSAGDIKREKSCCHGYWSQMKTLNEISTIVLNNCELGIYNRILENTVNWLENCDPLDHTRILYFFLMIESLIPKSNPSVKDSPALNSFKRMLPRISCCLIKISKSVELGPSIHAFTRPGSHKSSLGIQCCTYANCIKIYTLIYQRYSMKVTNSLITDSMQILVSSNLMQYAKHSVRLHKNFIQLASAIVGLLKSIRIGIKEEEVLKSSMPIYLSTFSTLIRCLILASDQQKLETFPQPRMNGHSNPTVGDGLSLENTDLCSSKKEFETQLELLALDVARILNNLSYSKVKMVDFAPHLISTYIKDIQRASCPDFVKTHLNEGIFRIFNLVDAHQRERQEEVFEAGIQRKTTAGRANGSLFEMIHARLDQASREIFRDMHDNYNRFHRYLGKC